MLRQLVAGTRLAGAGPPDQGIDRGGERPRFQVPGDFMSENQHPPDIICTKKTEAEENIQLVTVKQE